MGKRGKGERLPQFVPMLIYVLDSPAFMALSPLAQALYLRLKRRCGIRGARNGEVFYSVREAGEDLNVNKNTIAKAFHDLQGKGFLVPVQIGHLGMTGEGRATIWTMTEHTVDRLFLKWTPGADFPVIKGKVNRPENQKPVPKKQTACPKFSDDRAAAQSETGSPCMKISDVQADIGKAPVPKKRTSKDMPSPDGETGKALGRVVPLRGVG